MNQLVGDDLINCLFILTCDIPELHCYIFLSSARDQKLGVLLAQPHLLDWLLVHVFSDLHRTGTEFKLLILEVELIKHRLAMVKSCDGYDEFVSVIDEVSSVRFGSCNRA
jgi:hypothetical protein